MGMNRYIDKKFPRAEIELGKLKDQIKALKTAGIAVESPVIMEYREANNTASVDVTATSYTARTLNTLIYDPNDVIQNPKDFIGLAGTNTDFELPPGDYYIKALYLGGSRNTTTGTILSKLSLYNVEDASYPDLLSLNIRGQNAGSDAELFSAEIEGFFTVSGPQNRSFQIQQQSSVAGQSTGSACNFGDDEVYGRVLLKKIETKTILELLEEAT